ncbi:MAG: UDP-N-acetylglucosamine 2-epimerase (hydrolyzing) [Bacteroidales bacterium]|nr:UDP-N-acetylglucosamine 2-epimerase (hydrolyzing) [Bacteroidales bacterium]
MRVAILTSSRADYGIYLPLLKALRADPYFELEIIAFGTHLSKYHGYTLNEIEKSGFEVNHIISSMLVTDDSASIATAYAITAMKFSTLWEQYGKVYDWVFCLGDRYEMAAAVAAGIPFNIPFAHIHGGETTLGAIDNIYRHSITLASKLHFVAAENFAKRVKEIVGSVTNCVVTGSLSLENLKEIALLSVDDFNAKWNINLTLPSILVTIHPETIAFEKNLFFADEVFTALQKINLKHQLIITMPNADTMGSVYRSMFEKLKEKSVGKVHLIENFGTQSYFSCLKHIDLILGNSSSGIIEAATFGIFVLDIGDRQKGRLTSGNVIHVPFDSRSIIESTNKQAGKHYDGDNIYFKENATQIIIQSLKEYKY